MDKLYLGIELGSTRKKSVLIDKSGKVFASGSHTWENKLVNNLWTYDEERIINGVSESINDLFYGFVPRIETMGVSGMMHGYIALDEVPCTRKLTKDEVETDYELNTGKVIVETFEENDNAAVPAVLVKNHGPFTWGEQRLKRLSITRLFLKPSRRWL